MLTDHLNILKFDYQESTNMAFLVLASFITYISSVKSSVSKLYVYKRFYLSEQIELKMGPKDDNIKSL